MCWVWTPDKTFSTSSAYRAFYVGQYQVNGAKVLHKTQAPGKCKFLVWLALHDRCWTAERRKRHGLQDDDACILCNQEPESIDHLLLLCPFSREIWFRVLSWFSWGEVAPDSQAFNLAVWWAAARKRIPRDTCKGFDSIVVLYLGSSGKNETTGPLIDGHEQLRRCKLQWLTKLSCGFRRVIRA